MVARAFPLVLLLTAAPLRAHASPLEFTVAHSFSIDDAKSRIEMLLAYWGERYGVKHRWEGMIAVVEGRIMGVDVSAELVVEGALVRGRANDPGLLLRNAARDYISRKLRKYLHPAYVET